MTPTFIVDSMLGGLARWLRMLGYDTLYYRSGSDNLLLKIAEIEDRIILTRDKKLYWRAKKKKLTAIYMPESDVSKWLKRLHETLGLRLEIPEETTRCPICNSTLRKVKKWEIKSEAPKHILEKYDEFWKCYGCGKIYWKGPHWDSIEKRLSKVRDEARRSDKTW